MFRGELVEMKQQKTSRRFRYGFSLATLTDGAVLATPPCIFLVSLCYRRRNLGSPVFLNISFLGCCLQDTATGMSIAPIGPPSWFGTEDASMTSSLLLLEEVAEDEDVHRRQNELETFLQHIFKFDKDSFSATMVRLHASLLVWVAIIGRISIICEVLHINRAAQKRYESLSRSSSSATDTAAVCHLSDFEQDVPSVAALSNDDSLSSTNTIWLVAQSHDASSTSGMSTPSSIMRGMLSFFLGEYGSVKNESCRQEWTVEEQSMDDVVCPRILQTTDEPILHYSEQSPQRKTSAAAMLLSYFISEQEALHEEEPIAKEWSVDNIPPWSALHTSTDEDICVY